MISLTRSHWFGARRRNDLTMMMKKLENSRSDNEIYKSEINLVRNSLINQSSFFLNNSVLSIPIKIAVNAYIHTYIG